MDWSLWNSPGKNIGVGSHSLLQGIFPTQGSNLGLLHYRQILYYLRHMYIYMYVYICMWDSQVAQCKESACQSRKHKRLECDPWVGEIPLEKEMTTHSSILA